MELKLDAVTHRYGDTEVLRDVSLDIPTGRITCIVGPSGCGKFRLLRLLGGLEEPSETEVVAEFRTSC